MITKKGNNLPIKISSVNHDTTCKFVVCKATHISEKCDIASFPTDFKKSKIQWTYYFYVTKRLMSSYYTWPPLNNVSIIDHIGGQKIHESSSFTKSKDNLCINIRTKMAKIVAQKDILPDKYDFVSYPKSMYYLDNGVRLQMANPNFAFSYRTLILIMQSVSQKIRAHKIYYGLIRFTHQEWSILNTISISTWNQFLFQIWLHYKVQKYILNQERNADIKAIQNHARDSSKDYKSPFVKKQRARSKRHKVQLSNIIMYDSLASCIAHHNSKNYLQNYEIQEVLEVGTSQRHFAVIWHNTYIKSPPWCHTLFHNKHHIVEKIHREETFVTKYAAIGKNIITSVKQCYLKEIKHFLRLIMRAKVCYILTCRIRDNIFIGHPIVPRKYIYEKQVLNAITLNEISSLIHQIVYALKLVRRTKKGYKDALHQCDTKEQIYDEPAAMWQCMNKYVIFAEQGVSIIKHKVCVGRQKFSTANIEKFYAFGKFYALYILESHNRRTIHTKRRSYVSSGLPPRIAKLHKYTRRLRQQCRAYHKKGLQYPIILHYSHSYITAWNALKSAQTAKTFKLAKLENVPHLSTDRTDRAEHSTLSLTSTICEPYQIAQKGGANTYYSTHCPNMHYEDPYPRSRELNRHAIEARTCKVARQLCTPRQDYRPKHKSAAHKCKMPLQPCMQLRASRPAHSKKLLFDNIGLYSTQRAAHTKGQLARRVPSSASLPRQDKEVERDKYDEISCYFSTVKPYYRVRLSYTMPYTSIYYLKRHVVERALFLQHITAIHITHTLSSMKYYSVTGMYCACYVPNLGVTFICVRLIDTRFCQHKATEIDQISHIHVCIKDDFKRSYYIYAHNDSIKQDHYEVTIKLYAQKIPEYKIHFKNNIINKTVKFYNVNNLSRILLSIQSVNKFCIIYTLKQFKWMHEIKPRVIYVSQFRYIGIKYANIILLQGKNKIILIVNYSLLQAKHQNKLIYNTSNFKIRFDSWNMSNYLHIYMIRLFRIPTTYKITGFPCCPALFKYAPTHTAHSLIQFKSGWKPLQKSAYGVAAQF